MDNKQIVLNRLEDVKNIVEEADESMFRNNTLDHIDDAITQAHKLTWYVEGDRVEAEAMTEHFLR